MIGRTSFLVVLAVALSGHGASAQRAAAGVAPSFTVVNRTTEVVRELFATPAGIANFGRNRLDGKTNGLTSLAPGARCAIRRRPETNCVFDFKVVFESGHAEEKRGVNVCSNETVAIGVGSPPPSPAIDPATGKAGDDPSFRLFNRAAIPIIEVYVSPSGQSSAPSNRLSGDALAPDGKLAVSLPRDGNCFYDLKVVFGDHKVKERKHANLCKLTDLPVP